ncbi:MAG: hypothetical protein ACK46S_07230 [Bacteroidota bacterium]|jgi:hypothetical protein
MKKFFLLYSIIILFIAHSAAQQIKSNKNIVCVYTLEGTVFTGFSDDLNADPIAVKDFKLGLVYIKSSQVRNRQLFELENYVKVMLNDGRVINGAIEKIGHDSLTLLHVNLGKINIPYEAVATIRESRAELSGKWNVDPNCTRYFFAPSAFMLRKGEGYYQNAYILSNSVNYGVSDHFTIGGGVILPILFYITPKVGYSVNKYVHVSAGILAGGTYLNKGIGAGIGYGLVTLGTRDYHFTVGAGYGTIYQNDQWKNTEKPIITLSANARITRRFSVVSENWIFQLPFDKEVQRIDTINGGVYYYSSMIETVKKQVSITTLGGRFVWDKLTLDLGLLAPINFQDVNLVLPYIDLVVKF